jgi:hypothetical protein
MHRVSNVLSHVAGEQSPPPPIARSYSQERAPGAAAVSWPSPPPPPPPPLSNDGDSGGARSGGTGDTLPEPQLLSDQQVKSYIQNGFLALPVTDFPPEWHTAFWQKCHDWSYAGQAEKQQDSRHVFPHIAELGAVLSSRVMRGALSSVLGPDYVQHPHRTMHNYGNRNGDMQMAPGSDQTWCVVEGHRRLLSATQQQRVRHSPPCVPAAGTKTGTMCPCAPTFPAGAWSFTSRRG